MQGLLSNPDWHNWRWQLRHAVRTCEELNQLISLTTSEKRTLEILDRKVALPLTITPHFLSLMDHSDLQDPLRRQLIPNIQEFEEDSDERRDPLGEEDHEVVPHLIHRYPDRVLLLITDRCASYCRFCTRKRWVGQGPTPKTAHLQQALQYIREHTEIREVIISGGDALMLDDDRLESLMKQIRAIESVEIIRMATRMLTFAPMRITERVAHILKKHNPVYVMSHINHPHEIGPDAEKAIAMLIDAGVPVLNQSVLLKGINDSAKILSELFRKLTSLRVRPYDLHQCDVAPGTAQFRVPLDCALEIMSQLRGHISGLNIPHFIVDIPGGFGKVSLVPNAIVDRTKTHIYLKGFDGEVAAYPLD